MFDILYEDAHLLAVNKPAGLSTTAPAIAGMTLERMARAHFRPDLPSAAYVGLVHRLDRPVSGVVLMAKTPRAARRISRQFEYRQVRKVYWAVVHGQGIPCESVWEDWLYREETGLGRVQTCAPGTPRAQQARCQAQLAPAGLVRSTPEGSSMLRLQPETGRMHQLRVQSSSRGWPILGDRLYGSPIPFEEGIALHARSLTVQHPALQEPIRIEAPPPPHWAGWGIVLDNSIED